MTNRNNHRTLLASFAHPDDESFGSGGTLTHYASKGVKVALVCATRGEVGEISDSALASKDNLGEVREQELRRATDIMGIKELTFLGFRDSGMAGTDDNNHPRAFSKAPESEITVTLVGIMRRLRPQVVVTFDPNGGYGHPDHIYIHQNTVAAFHASGDAKRYPEQGEPWQPFRLFYVAFPRARFQQMRELMETEGLDTSEFARFEQSVMLWPDEKINVSMDLSKVVDAKLKALQQHQTQLNPNSLFSKLSEGAMKQVMSQEHFVLASPEPAPNTKLSDLFDGL